LKIIPKQISENKEQKALFEENKNLKFTILRMLNQIQLFENGEINRQKETDVNFIYIEMLFTNSL
jgi:hypothetical protein